MTFHVGQKVVCVDASLPPNPWHRKHPLVLRQIYTVSEIAPPPAWEPQCSSLGIDGSGRVWECWRFRPIVSRKTDISIFTRMLTDGTVDA